MRLKITKTSISILLSLPLTMANAEEPNSPNVILIMCDDLGWGDVGFNGNNTILTPHLDALARDGIVFDRFYSAAPVSSPTRASALTGRHPFRSGVFHANQGILRPEEISIPEMIKPQGYTSGHFGKWHLGILTDKENDANRGGTRFPELLNPPSSHGYDEAFVTESKVPTYDPMNSPVEKKINFWDYIKAGEPSFAYGTYYWNIKGEKVSDNLNGDNSRVIMDRVIPYIDNAIDANQPFFSVVWFHTPHLPCVAGPEHAAIYQRYSLEERNYYGCITAMDEQVGRLVAYLKNTGVYDNTLIFFCSDNGPERNTPGSTSGLRERKRSLYEGGIRVPALAVWPNRIDKGQRLSAPCSTSDYLPTVADILKLTVSQVVDGESILPLLVGETDRRIKPIVFASETQAAVVENDYKLYQKNGVYELYNITSDRSEIKNIADEEPDKLKSMKSYLHNALNEFKRSFEGEEYGTTSYNKVKQSWRNVLSPQKK